MRTIEEREQKIAELQNSIKEAKHEIPQAKRRLKGHLNEMAKMQTIMQTSLNPSREANLIEHLQSLVKTDHQIIDTINHRISTLKDFINYHKSCIEDEKFFTEQEKKGLELRWVPKEIVC
ncbi:MAG TPA: hypothetical protein VK213_05945 [Bacteroidales bacterium]|nr:hypothetical protein [Bacteroidales bacterium]